MSDSSLAFLSNVKYVLAPMVDQSELAFRMLCRKYNTHCCFSPMYHAAIFCRDATYRKDALQTCPEDRPLIIQFCADDPGVFMNAAHLTENKNLCDAIDLNLGCPQVIAKRGNYGAFLQDDWRVINEIVSTCSSHISIPVSCKIRVFPDLQKTVQYSQMLAHAGAKFLTVHGRTREQKGALTGLADWDKISNVKKSVTIPVFANGNIQYHSDIKRCLIQTGVDAVMSAEGMLHNPTLFANETSNLWDIANEYLDFVRKYPCPLSFSRTHLFKLFHHALFIHEKIRDDLALARTFDDLRSLTNELKVLSHQDILLYQSDPSANINHNFHIASPYWIAQPYLRPLNNDASADIVKCKRIISEQLQDRISAKKAKILNLQKTLSISKKTARRLIRNPRLNLGPRQIYEDCLHCKNKRGFSCPNKLCKTCCTVKSRRDILDCINHRLKFRTNFEKANKIEASG